MTDVLFGPILDVIAAFAVLGGGALVVGGGVMAAPRMLGLLRQRAYDRATATDRKRWVIRPDPASAGDPDTARRLVAGLHPGGRRGTSGWASGWPELTLALRWTEGRARFEIEAPRQLGRSIEAAVAAAYPSAEIEAIPPPPSSSTGLRLAIRGEPPQQGNRAGGRGDVGASLVELLSRLPRGATASWMLSVRPLAPGAERASDGAPGLGETLLDSFLNRPSRPVASSSPALRPRPDGPSFAVTAGLVADAAEPKAVRAWLFDAMSIVGVLRGAGWAVEAAVGGRSAPMTVGPRDLAELWGLSAAAEARALDVVRSRRLRAPVADRISAGERPIGREGDRLIGVPAEVFLRHAAFIGKTGSGKSTELVALAADDLRSGRGFTFLDPHGDAVRRLLDCVPPSEVERVHVLELAERRRPRSFNPLELDGADPELVAGQFVDTVRELYLGTGAPRQVHYLRNGLMTMLLKDPGGAGPWTILDLYELLVDPDRRKAFTIGLTDPLLQAFWNHEWPAKLGTGRDPSAEALLNKLSSFIGYPSIRQIVAARRSSIRPRRIMDEGRVLLVDLSRAARDHGRLFGSLLIARYCIDALARQGVPEDRRRPHQLYLDEAHAFDTSSLRTIVTETRKFGLGATLATQYFDRMGDELRDAVLNDVGTLALLQPAATDARLLARSFEPLTERDLLGLERFRMAVRTELSGQATVFTADILPEPARSGRADLVRRLSDERDGHDPF
ncbi:MAG TPA: hypothetical protein VGQ89_16005 [Candidatus Limnocylindrales bacterium]|jgi:hypothetical protein|nr:hypothetical protein [Candidatus Limnocylindrales bacterium]